MSNSSPLPLFYVAYKNHDSSVIEWYLSGGPWFRYERARSALGYKTDPSPSVEYRWHELSHDENDSDSARKRALLLTFML